MEKINDKELHFENEKLSDTIRKVRITFYRHLVLGKSGLTTRIFHYVDKNLKTLVLNRGIFTEKVKEFWAVFSDTKTIWTEERKGKHSERVKEC